MSHPRQLGLPEVNCLSPSRTVSRGRRRRQASLPPEAGPSSQCASLEGQGWLGGDGGHEEAGACPPGRAERPPELLRLCWSFRGRSSNISLLPPASQPLPVQNRGSVVWKERPRGPLLQDLHLPTEETVQGDATAPPTSQGGHPCLPGLCSEALVRSCHSWSLPVSSRHPEVSCGSPAVILGHRLRCVHSTLGSIYVWLSSLGRTPGRTVASCDCVFGTSWKSGLPMGGIPAPCLCG